MKRGWVLFREWAVFCKITVYFLLHTETTYASSLASGFHTLVRSFADTTGLSDKQVFNIKCNMFFFF